MTESFIRLPPDSTGKQSATKQHTIDAETVHVSLQHIADPDVPTNRQAVDADGAAFIRFAEGPPVIDAFGNLTVTQPKSESQYLHDIDPQTERWWADLANGGTITWEQNRSAIAIATTTASGSKAVRTSNRYHYYTPGQALATQHSVYLGDTGQVGNTRRWGYFDDANGAFFELQDTTFNVVLRTSVGGVLSETRVAQASFNRDKLNGSGKSGMNINLLFMQMYWVDFQWHGAGQVRMGVYAPSGNRITCHVFENANSQPGPYSQTARLPIRFENENTGLIGSPAELYQISGVVRDYGNSPIPWRTHEAVEIENVALNATYEPILAVRPPQLYQGVTNRLVYRLDDLVVFATGGPVAVQIIRDPATLTGPSFSLDAAGTMELDTSATAFTGGEVEATFFVPQNETRRVDLDRYTNSASEPFVLSADGTTQPEFLVVAKRLDASGNFYGALTYAEV